MWSDTIVVHEEIVRDVKQGEKDAVLLLEKRAAEYVFETIREEGQFNGKLVMSVDRSAGVPGVRVSARIIDNGHSVSSADVERILTGKDNALNRCQEYFEHCERVSSQRNGLEYNDDEVHYRGVMRQDAMDAVLRTFDPIG